MKLIDMRGKGISLNVGLTKNNPASSKSKLQESLKNKLAELFPHEVILEEFNIPGSRMSLDFFVPRRRNAYEADGPAHREFNSHYHGLRTDNKFAGQIKRDIAKENWCELNNIKLTRITSEADLDTL